MRQNLLLCPTDYFTVNYSINPWMDPSVPVDKNKVKQEWNDLVALYKQLGYSVSIITPVKGLPDMVFAANGFFNIGKKAIVARFRYPERQGETKHFTHWLKEHGFEIIDPEKICYEGQGDTLLIDDIIFQGWGFRSDKEITKLMETTFPGYQVIPLHLINDKFYHLDTCFFPINKDLAFYYDKAFDDNSIKAIKNAFKKPVAVSDEEAMTFALNAVTTGSKVVMNSKAKKFKDRVKSEGFEVYIIETGEFQKSGGSAKCLTNEY